MEKAIIKSVISELDKRKGFDNWWYDIDEDIKEEIIETLESVVKEKLKNPDK